MKNKDGEEYLDSRASQEVGDQAMAQKREIVHDFMMGLKLADSLKQSWLLFNGAIYVWNSYLPYFKTV
jgi:hypothetical protein